jgi:mRNA-degrading endonuclease RelE of RelBE toxin-antitoxin system
MRYDVSNQVMAVLEKMDEDTHRRVFSGIMALPEFGDTKPLEGRHAGLYRQRIGDWRVIFTVDDDDNVLVGYILPPKAAAAGAGEGATRRAAKDVGADGATGQSGGRAGYDAAGRTAADAGADADVDTGAGTGTGAVAVAAGKGKDKGKGRDKGKKKNKGKGK